MFVGRADGWGVNNPRDLTLFLSLEGGETVGRVLRLDHFPDRKNRATRLRMTIYFSSAHRCEIEVEDLGFGGITPSSGRVWKRQVIL